MESYDAIVIGGGHNGLTLAAYLQRAGIQTLLLERRHEWGSGLNTEEATAPGFLHNMHAQYMEFIDYMPFYHDFGLEKLGAKMIYPVNQCGITFADGRPPVIVHNPDHLDLTYKSIAQYSKHDAEVFCELKRKTMEIDHLFGMLYWNPPAFPPDDSLRGSDEMTIALLKHLGLGREMLSKSMKVVIDETFETPELRMMLYRVCLEWGSPPEWSVNGFGFIVSILWMIGIWKMCVGGTHTLSHAMESACKREGVAMRENSLVREITVKNGRAIGVVLEDGTKFEAKKLVASNADLKQTFFDLVGKKNMSDLWIKRVSNFRIGPDHCLGTLAFALREAPDYKSAKRDPNINKTFYTVVGYETPDDMINYIREANQGKIPSRPGAGTWVNSLWDPTQAPSGKHAMTGWYFFPKASELTPEQWDDVRANYNEKFRQLWVQYAPNMTRDNVIADVLYTPLDMEQKNLMREGCFSNGSVAADQAGWMRPFPEASQYRTEIDGLYLCGPYTHPAGGVFAACGYNAFKIIAEDHGLPKLWEQTDRGY